MFRPLRNMISGSILLFITACQTKKETVSFPPVSDYYPQAVGKYITYQLDSTVYVDIGQTMEIHSYQVKDLIESAITDNEGRPGFKVRRFMRDLAGTQPWQDNATFVVTPLDQSIEFVDNNLRYIRLKDPVRDGFNWKGNAYIETTSINSDLKYLDGWDYTYVDPEQPFSINGFNFENTLTVDQRDETLGNPSDPSSYSEENYSIEIFAKGVGLVYKDFLHYEYQPPLPPRSGYYVGYGVKLTILDHNW